MQNLDHKARQAAHLFSQGQRAEAEALYYKILSTKPDHAVSLNGLGVAMAARNELDMAIKLIHAAIGVDGSQADYYYNLGSLLSQQGRFADGIKFYHEAIKRQPEHGEAYNNLGAALEQLDRPDEAAACYRAALTIAPNDGQAHNNLGLILSRLGDFGEARDHFRRAVALAPVNPGMRWNYAVALLLHGDFAQGWQEADWRFGAGIANRPALPTPLWQGEDIQGKTILVHGEQGLGDNIQFVRFLPRLQALGAHIILASQRPLFKLFGNVAGADETYLEENAIPPHDVHASLLDLPLRLGVTEDAIRTDGPYLRADPVKAEGWRDRLQTMGGLNVGIAWRGSPSHKNDKNRSMTAMQFAILAQPGARFVNLQKDATPDELAMLRALMPDLYDAAPMLDDLTDTAALIDALDLVVTVDTAICHLAGALGARVFTLLPFQPDWRWMLARADTPWYPAMRLFRQAGRGDWASAIAAVKNAIAAQ